VQTFDVAVYVISASGGRLDGLRVVAGWYVNWRRRIDGQPDVEYVEDDVGSI